MELIMTQPLAFVFNEEIAFTLIPALLNKSNFC